MTQLHQIAEVKGAPCERCGAKVPEGLRHTSGPFEGSIFCEDHEPLSAAWGAARPTWYAQVREAFEKHWGPLYADEQALEPLWLMASIGADAMIGGPDADEREPQIEADAAKRVALGLAILSYGCEAAQEMMR